MCVSEMFCLYVFVNIIVYNLTIGIGVGLSTDSES